MTAPSAWTIQSVMAIANATLERMAREGTLDTDEAALMDALRDGGADVDGLLARLLRARGEAVANDEAIHARIGALVQRQGRFKRQAEEYRAAVNAIMASLGITKWRHAEFSVSVAPGRSGVTVTDVDALPAGYVHVTKTPDKAAIKAAMEQGEVINGAEWQNPAPTLRILTK